MSHSSTFTGACGRVCTCSDDPEGRLTKSYSNFKEAVCASHLDGSLRCSFTISQFAEDSLYCNWLQHLTVSLVFTSDGASMPLWWKVKVEMKKDIEGASYKQSEYFRVGTVDRENPIVVGQRGFFIWQQERERWLFFSFFPIDARVYPRYEESIEDFNTMSNKALQNLRNWMIAMYQGDRPNWPEQRIDSRSIGMRGRHPDFEEDEVFSIGIEHMDEYDCYGNWVQSPECLMPSYVPEVQEILMGLTNNNNQHFSEPTPEIEVHESDSDEPDEHEVVVISDSDVPVDNESDSDYETEQQLVTKRRRFC